MIMLWVCVVIAAVVFGAMIYAMVKFRKSKGAVADRSSCTTPRLEVIWTVIPIVILVVMAMPAAETLMHDRGHRGLRPDRQGHRLPVDVAVRVPRHAA